MKQRNFVLPVEAYVFSLILFLSSCSKINEATELGGDLLPAVDNVTTFDTTVNVETYNDVFTILNDSTRSGRGEEHFLGEITSDPLFGKTNASIFLELKPSFPFVIKDTLPSIDSVVLVLSYKETYGDTVAAYNARVYEIDPFNNFRSDSFYLIRERPFMSQGPLLGSRNTVVPSSLKDSVFLLNEKSSNQLRIKLNNSFGQRLLDLNMDGYKTDSAFKTAFKGFEITATGGNSIMGFQLTDTNTKLAIYYKYKKNGQDTASVIYFRTTLQCASANHITRDYSGSQLAAYQGGTSPDNLVFLQNTPGSFATIKIPGLAAIKNRIVHRAELIVEQVFDLSDARFPPPDLLYLDAFDVLKNKYRAIPVDVVYDPNGGQVNASSFGMIGKQTVDNSGNSILIWKFNISRYIQKVLTDSEPAYDLRLSSPSIIYNLYNFQGIDTEIPLSINSGFAKGRVRVGGGNHSTQKMRLRMIYSKI